MRILLAFLMLFAGVCCFANDGKNTLKGLALEQAKLPVFNKDRLQLVAFCDRAKQQGDIMIGVNTVLDIIRRDADGDTLKDGWDLQLYPLNTPLKDIVAFWKPRLYSEGVVKTAGMDINQKARTASGNCPVSFRSTALDLDGVGFDCDFKRRTIFVRSDVKVVLRTAEYDPRNILKKNKEVPVKKDFLRATSGSLLVDSENNQVMLIGSVKVYEGDSRIDCDRMTIVLAGKEDKKKGAALAEQVEGISRILCDGNVRITNSKRPDEKAFADHLAYDVRSRTVLLTGDEKYSRILRGKESVAGKRMVLFRDGEKAVAFGGCRVEMMRKNGKTSTLVTITSDIGRFYNTQNHIDFLGNVKIDEPEMVMTCDRMRVLLLETGKKTVKAEKKKTDDNLTGLPEFGNGGQKELDSIKCRGNVRIIRKEENKKVRNGKGRTALQQWMSAGAEPEWELCAGSKIAETFIDSDSCDIDYRSNVVYFKNNVKFSGPRGKVECQMLHLYMKKKNGSDDKTIDRVVCQGKVHLIEESGELWSDKLTIYFREVPAGRKGKPGKFEKNGIEMILITGEGNFKMVSAQKNGKNRGGLGSLTGKGTSSQTIIADSGELDFVKNESKFLKNVCVSDQEGSLRCQELYLYSTNTADVKKAKPVIKEPVVDDPDADPLSAGIARPAAVPEKIVISDGLELSRVLCKGDVLLTRQTPKGVQKAGGDMADYVVSSGEAVLTAEKGKQPWMQDGSGARMSGDKIVVNIKNEAMTVVGNSNLDVKK